MAKLDVKGMNNSLVFVFSEGSAEEFQAILREKLDSNPKLFQGSSILFQGEGLASLAPEEVISLQQICLDHGLYFVSPEAPDERAVRRRVKAETAPADDLIVHRTLRSGQKVQSEGSVTIWGDVHESAEITAGGDVIVLGRLEGVAHAGCYGNRSCYIFALTLCPRQLRIGDHISRSSGKVERTNYPEIAYISDDNICIKEYSSRASLLR